MGNLLSELRRRNVFKVAIAFLMLSWLILQLVDVLTPILDLPESFARVVFVALLILLPITLIISWAFELTPDGLKKTDEVELEHSIRQTTGQKINYIIICFLALAVIFLIYDRGTEPEEIELANTIAVMPFADMSADGDQGYFGDGMAEEILNVIVSIDELDVTSRTTAFSLKGENLSVPEIAERLNVNYILEGSIRSDGNNIRVTAQLIDVANDTHLWSDTYDRELTSIFAIQDEISLAIADALKVELLGEVIGDVPTQNMEAYALYLQGRQTLYVPSFDKSLQARVLANRIIELDPNYAEGWGLLAASYNTSRGYNFLATLDEEELLSGAIEAANKALSLKPDLSFAWAEKSFTHIIRHQWKEAKFAIDNAIRLNPKEERSWMILAEYYINIADAESAIGPLMTALELNPGLARPYERLARSFVSLGDFEQARANIQKGLESRSSGVNSHLAEIALIEGNKEDAKKYYRLFIQNLEFYDAKIFDTFIDAYFDPTLREDAKKILLELGPGTGVYFAGMLLQDGAFVAQRTTGRQIIYLYEPTRRAMLNHSAMKDLVREFGLVGHWRETKWPPFCRPIGDDDFECQDAQGNYP